MGGEGDGRGGGVGRLGDASLCLRGVSVGSLVLGRSHTGRDWEAGEGLECGGVYSGCMGRGKAGWTHTGGWAVWEVVSVSKGSVVWTAVA